MTPSPRVNVHLSYVIALNVLMPMSIQLSMTGQPSIQRNLLACVIEGQFLCKQATHTAWNILIAIRYRVTNFVVSKSTFLDGFNSTCHVFHISCMNFSAIYFIFLNSSFQRIVSTYIHKSSSKYVVALVHMCVRTRDFFIQKHSTVVCSINSAP